VIDLVVHANLDKGIASFVITGKREDGSIIRTPTGHRDLSDIKDHQDQWFLGLTWICDAVPRASTIYISDKTIIEIINTQPVEAAIKKVLGDKENFKLAMSFLNHRKVEYIERKDNLSFTEMEAHVIEDIIKDGIPTPPIPKSPPKPKAPKLPKVNKEE
jgi:hypothetical protein